MKDIEKYLSAQFEELKRATLLQAKEWLTAEDLAMLLGYKISYVYKITSEGKLPCYKPDGRKVFYKRARYIPSLKKAECQW